MINIRKLLKIRNGYYLTISKYDFANNKYLYMNYGCKYYDFIVLKFRIQGLSILPYQSRLSIYDVIFEDWSNKRRIL